MNLRISLRHWCVDLGQKVCSSLANKPNAFLFIFVTSAFFVFVCPLRSTIQALAGLQLHFIEPSLNSIEATAVNSDVDHEIEDPLLASRSASPNLYIDRIAFEPKEYGTRYCVATVQEAEETQDLITLMQHSTANYINEEFLETIATWDGRVSWAILVRRPSDVDAGHGPSFGEAYKKIREMLTCHPSLARKLSIHLYYERKYKTECGLIEIACRHIMGFIPQMLEGTSHEWFELKMKKKKLQFSNSTYFISGDLGQYYSDDFEKDMRKLAVEENLIENKRVLVFRRFEVEDYVRIIPRRVKGLKSLFDRKLAFEFHSLCCPEGHVIRGLDLWFQSFNETFVVDEIVYSNPAWEPQFVAHRSVPFHDESIYYRRGDQTVLSQELCRAGYSFRIVSKHFNVHRGVKRTLTQWEAKLVEGSEKYRRKGAKEFLARLDRLYPPAELPRICHWTGKESHRIFG